MGRARNVTCDPNTLTASAVQSFRKPGWRIRLRPAGADNGLPPTGVEVLELGVATP